MVYVRRSKTDQDGTAADVRYLKNGCAAALRQLRDRLTVQRSGLRPDPVLPAGRARIPRTAPLPAAADEAMMMLRVEQSPALAHPASRCGGRAVSNSSCERRGSPH